MTNKLGSANPNRIPKPKKKIIRQTLKIKANDKLAQVKFFNLINLQYQYWTHLQEASECMAFVMNNIDVANHKGMAEKHVADGKLIQKQIMTSHPDFNVEKLMPKPEGGYARSRKLALPITYEVTDRQVKERWAIKINGYTAKVKKEIPQFIKFIIENSKRNNYLFDSKKAIWCAQDEYDMPDNYVKMDDLFHTPELKQLQDIIFEPIQKSEGTYRLRLDLWLSI